jgi:acetyl-CoA acetyltransferase
VVEPEVSERRATTEHAARELEARGERVAIGGGELGLVPKARYVTCAVAGVEPSYMGLGPVPATRIALSRAGYTAQRIDLAELNEAFAAQAIPCIEQIGLDPERVNIHGGAIAWGHPLGASGARLLLSLMIDLELTAVRTGLAAMCIGVGQGIATIIERV